jgi:pectinesterase
MGKRIVRACWSLGWALVVLGTCQVARGESTTVQDYASIAGSLALRVAADGSAPFASIQAALDAIPWQETRWVVVHVAPGVYKEKLRIQKCRVILKGAGRDKTRIEYAQLRADYEKRPDKLGPGVVNIFADEVVLDDLTVANTGDVLGPHQFALYGNGDRIVLTNSDFVGLGGDTVALWESLYGCYYHENCSFKGGVDFVCPRGFCFITRSRFYEVAKTAAIWHDGRCWKDYKLVITDSELDGVPGWQLGRYHNDAQFYLLRCRFSASMADQPLVQTSKDERALKWGERVYFHDCHREGGDYAWHRDNLAKAFGAPRPEDVTPAWTFGGRWDPLPIVREVEKLR